MAARVFVTGGSGYLGKCLRKSLELKGYEVVAPTSKEFDLLSASNNDFGGNFKYIFHLAAWTQAGDFCLKYPGDQWVRNQLINANMVKWFLDFQRDSKIITIGTSCAYDPQMEHSEANYLKGNPTESLFSYAHTKRMLQIGLEALQKQHGINFLTVVPSTLFGANYFNPNKQMHFIFDIMRKIITGKVHGADVILWGDGSQRRELIFMNDFLQDLETLLQRDATGIYNIGGGVDFSIREIAERVSELVHFDSKIIKFDATKYVGAKKKFLVTDKLSNEIGLRRTDLMDSLQSTLVDFQSALRAHQII